MLFFDSRGTVLEKADLELPKLPWSRGLSAAGTLVSVSCYLKTKVLVFGFWSKVAFFLFSTLLIYRFWNIKKTALLKWLNQWSSDLLCSGKVSWSESSARWQVAYPETWIDFDIISMLQLYFCKWHVFLSKCSSIIESFLHIYLKQSSKVNFNRIAG